MRTKLTVNIDPKTYRYLSKLGIPANLLGYQYMAHILQKHVDEIPDGQITLFYDTIGKEMGSTGSRVERALRHMVEISWFNMEESDLKNQLASHTKYARGGCPTVSAYLYAVAFDFMNFRNMEA